MPMRADLGDRMKSQYEDRTRYQLPRRTWTVIRADGRAFHSFTRGCSKPFDPHLHASMVAAAVALCREAQGAKVGYVQSDEISVVLTDFDDIHTQAWFDGNVQKITSVSASVVTAEFNHRYRQHPDRSWALFDARVFTIPDPVEIENYLIWRQKDAIRNSVSSLAQSMFSPNQLHGKDRAQMLEMCRAKGKSWEEWPAHVQRGTVVQRHPTGWQPDFDAPVFTEDRAYLKELLRVESV